MIKARDINMKDIKFYETRFKEYGWDKYLSNLYEWHLQGKDIKELGQIIVQIEGGNNPLPNIITDGEAEIKCNPTGCSVSAPESTNIYVGAPPGFKPRFNGKRAWVEREIFLDDETE